MKHLRLRNEIIGEEMGLTAYQDDGDFGNKSIAEQRQWIAELRANPDDRQHNCDADAFAGLLEEALVEIERLQSLLKESNKDGDDLALSLSNLEFEKDALFDTALEYKKRAEKAEELVERLVEAGNALDKPYKVIVECGNLDELKRWDALVDECNVSKD